MGPLQRRAGSLRVGPILSLWPAEGTIDRSRGASFMTITKSRLRRTMTFAAVAAVAALAFGAAAPASAVAGDGRWYFDDFHIADHHAAGLTGKGITIAVLDGPINTSVPTLKNANVEVREPSFCYGKDGAPAAATSTTLTGDNSAYHGTNVVSYIAGTGDGYPGQTGVEGIAPGAKVLYYAVSLSAGAEAGGEVIDCLDANGTHLGDEVNEAMNEALDAGADIISISAGYNAASVGDAYGRAIRAGVIVVGSVANTNELAISLGFPAGANGAVGVQAGSVDFVVQATDGTPNKDTSTMVVAPGIGILTQGSRDGRWEDQPITQGTSLAAPMVAGYLALAWQKHPDASGNQMLQSLIRSPWDDDQVHFDPAGLIGFGWPTATRMIERDPTRYPDVNPFLDVRPANSPSTAELLAAPTTPPTASSSERSVAERNTPVMTIVVICVGSLVLLCVIILLIVLAVRRSKRKSSPEGRLNS
jgi:subtilisin family serine protease